MRSRTPWCLRQQLDDLRALKHELAFKLQSSDLGVKQKSELNSRLEEKTNQMAATIKQLEQRLRQAERDRQSAELDNRLSSRTSETRSTVYSWKWRRFRQRNRLELELKQEREGRSQNSRSIPGKGSQKPETKTDGRRRAQEENVQPAKPWKKATGCSLTLWMSRISRCSLKSPRCVSCAEKIAA